MQKQVEGHRKNDGKEDRRYVQSRSRVCKQVPHPYPALTCYRICLWQPVHPFNQHLCCTNGLTSSFDSWTKNSPVDSSRCLRQSAGRTSSGNRDGLSLTLQRLDCTATLLLLCCCLSCGVVTLLAECRAELLSLCAVMCTWQAAHSSSMCWRRQGCVCQRVYIRHAADSTSDWSSAVRNSHRGYRCK